MRQNNAKVNYFFGPVYRDCNELVSNVFFKCIHFISWLFSMCMFLAINFLKASGRVIVGVVERLKDAIADSWEGVTESFWDLWECITGDIIGHIGFWDMVGGFFKALFFTIKFGIFLAYFIANLVFTPLMCLVFTVLFLALGLAGIVAVLAGAGAVVLAIFVALGVLTVVVYIAMGFIACGVGISFLFMAFLDFMYRRIKKLSNGCPSCQTKFDLPIYKCPKCGRTHSRLIPSKYGILKRKCICGAKIPTTFLNGRQKLDALCPNCNNSLSGGAHTEIWIPVIGGPSSGKTCYVSMAISQIDEKIAPMFNMEFSYHAQGDDLYDDNKKIMEQGLLPQKTSDMTFKYYQFFLNQRGAKTSNFISLCDVAGELYADSDTFKRDGIIQGGFKQADGFLMVIDPLSLEDYRMEVENLKTADPLEYGASDKPMDSILDAMLDTIEKITSNTKAKIQPSCSIVITKCDLPGLEELVGEEAINAYMTANPKADRLTALNAVCEKFLKSYGANTLTKIQQKIKSYQFFTCSSLGHNVNGDKFAPVRVEDGLLWLINKKCPTLDFTKELKGKN